MDGNEQDKRAEYALRQILERFGEKQQNECNYRRGGYLRELALGAGTFNQRSLRWAAVDDKGTTEGCCDVSGGQSDEVAVRIDLLMVASCVDARGWGTLSD